MPCGYFTLFDFVFGSPLYDGRRIFNAGGIFSPNGQYVAIGEEGVYRLADQQKQFAIKGYEPFIQFSPDGQYLAVFGDALYRLNDGKALFQLSEIGVFSHDSTYIAVDYDGLYRLADGEKIFDIDDRVKGFTPDNEYVMVLRSNTQKGEGLHLISARRFIPYLTILHSQTGLMAIGNTILVLEPTYVAQHILFMLLEPSVLYNKPDYQSEIILPVYNTGEEYILGILDENSEWYRVSIGNKVGWIPASTAPKIYLP